MSKQDEEKVGGAIGGLAGIFGRVGFAVFSLLVGPSYTAKKIQEGAQVVMGSVVTFMAIGFVLGPLITLTLPETHISQGFIGGVVLGAILGGVIGGILGSIVS